MAVTHTTTFRNTVADLVDSTLGAGAQLVFRITGSTADAPTTAVATLTFPTPAFGAASNGVLTRTAGTMEDTNAAGGTIAFATLQTSGGTVVVHCQVAASGQDIDMGGSGLVVSAGATVSISTLTYTAMA